MTTEGREKRTEALLWSIAFPGFGQLVNKRYAKAFIFIILEVIINIKGNINGVIVKSFLLDMENAVEQANYAWLMFYPCIYLFAMWDAYKDAGGDMLSYKYIPFVIAAYFGTLGVIYSSRFAISNFLIGPIFLPIIAIVLGFLTGEVIRKLMLHRLQSDT